MREGLDDVELQHSKLMKYSPETISTHAVNAERYHKGSTSSNPPLTVLNAGSSNVRIASVIGFLKACLDITQTHESLILASEAILAARLALNSIPKVVPLTIVSEPRSTAPTTKLSATDSRHRDLVSLDVWTKHYSSQDHLRLSSHMRS